VVFEFAIEADGRCHAALVRCALDQAPATSGTRARGDPARAASERPSRAGSAPRRDPSPTTRSRRSRRPRVATSAARSPPVGCSRGVSTASTSAYGPVDPLRVHGRIGNTLGTAGNVVNGKFGGVRRWSAASGKR
jgi:hypothetical protein